MSEHGNCHDCGGTNGNHYSDCSYEGTGSGGSHVSSGGIGDGILLSLAVLATLSCPPLGLLMLIGVLYLISR